MLLSIGMPLNWTSFFSIHCNKISDIYIKYTYVNVLVTHLDLEQL